MDSLTRAVGVAFLVLCSASCDESTSGDGGAGGTGATSDGGQAAGAGSPNGGAPHTGGQTGTGGSDNSTSIGGGGGGDGGQNTGEEILHADFEAAAEGEYTEDMVAADFGAEPPWNDGLDQGRASIVDDGGERFLRVTYPANEYGPGDGGVQFKVPLNDSYEELHLSYRVRFGDNFQFVKGGKLPGLVGGSAPTGCVDDTTGFSARMMWRTAGAAVQYMYFPEKVNDCGDDYDYASGGSATQFEPGTWHTVEHHLEMNTPGEHDGILKAWFDGEPALDEQMFLYRLADATYEIDTLYFSTFFGGGDSSWAPTSDQVVDFDDFVVKTGRIGP
ncbi:MAG: hypothetical protein HOW73_00715 [Polyangiaceae bacterium]|nr:hypothetical protein [Polyangiaceae bacterium]